jgi:hypothetical protein
VSTVYCYPHVWDCQTLIDHARYWRRRMDLNHRSLRLQPSAFNSNSATSPNWLRIKDSNLTELLLQRQATTPSSPFRKLIFVEILQLLQIYIKSTNRGHSYHDKNETTSYPIKCNFHTQFSINEIGTQC